MLTQPKTRLPRTLRIVIYLGTLACLSDPSSTKASSLDFSASVSGVYDTNVSESGGYQWGTPEPGQSQVEGPQPGMAGGPPPPPPGQRPPALKNLTFVTVPPVYGLLSDLTLSKNLFDPKKDSTLTVGLNGFASAYPTEPTYNYDSAKAWINYLSGDPEEAENTWGVGISYLETFYDGRHYQNYSSATLPLTWKPDPSWKIDFSLDVTVESNPSQSLNYEPSATVTYDINDSTSLYLNASYVSAHGQKAVLTTGPNPQVVKGSLFSIYTIGSASAGIGFPLFGGIESDAWTRISITNYEAENLPKSAPAANPRQDVMKSAGFSLKRKLARDWLSVKLEVSHFFNRSTGFNGGPLVAVGEIPNYSFQRTVYSAGLTGNF